MLYGVRLVYRPDLVLPEELHAAISVPCPDKFTVPQHARRMSMRTPKHPTPRHVQHASIVHSPSPWQSSMSRAFTRTSKQLAQQACGLFDGGHLA